MDKFHIFRLRCSVKSLHREVGIITGFINESCSYPKLWNKKSKVHQKIPWTLSCVANNVRNGCTLEEAWTMPEGEAVWMSISHAVYNGSEINIVSTDDDNMMDDFDNIIKRFKESNIKK
jgi:hypothetical protein